MKCEAALVVVAVGPDVAVPRVEDLARGVLVAPVDLARGGPHESNLLSRCIGRVHREGRLRLGAN